MDKLTDTPGDSANLATLEQTELLADFQIYKSQHVFPAPLTKRDGDLFRTSKSC